LPLLSLFYTTTNHIIKAQQTQCNPTCDIKKSISLRVIPTQDKITDVESLLLDCAVPNTIKQFNQKNKNMFAAKICFNDISKLLAIKKKNTIIEKIQGGTKTSRSRGGIRKKPKINKKRIDCDGSCCRNCQSHKIKTVILTTTNYNAISSLVNECNTSDQPPQKTIKNSVDKYLFDMCRNDKHVLKKNEFVTTLRTYQDRNYYKCKRKCVESDVLDVNVITTNRKSMNSAKECAYSDSFNEDNIIIIQENNEQGDIDNSHSSSSNDDNNTSFNEDNIIEENDDQGDNNSSFSSSSSSDEDDNTYLYSTSIKICKNDRMNLYKMKGIQSVLPTCGIHTTFSKSCGSVWEKAASVCCPGLECDGVQCMEPSSLSPTIIGTFNSTLPLYLNESSASPIINSTSSTSYSGTSTSTSSPTIFNLTVNDTIHYTPSPTILNLSFNESTSSSLSPTISLYSNESSASPTIYSTNSTASSNSRTSSPTTMLRPSTSTLSPTILSSTSNSPTVNLTVNDTISYTPSPTILNLPSTFPPTIFSSIISTNDTTNSDIALEQPTMSRAPTRASFPTITGFPTPSATDLGPTQTFSPTTPYFPSDDSPNATILNLPSTLPPTIFNESTTASLSPKNSSTILRRSSSTLSPTILQSMSSSPTVNLTTNDAMPYTPSPTTTLKISSTLPPTIINNEPSTSSLSPTIAETSSLTSSLSLSKFFSTSYVPTSTSFPT